MNLGCRNGTANQSLGMDCDQPSRSIVRVPNTGLLSGDAERVPSSTPYRPKSVSPRDGKALLVGDTTNAEPSYETAAEASADYPSEQFSVIVPRKAVETEVRMEDEQVSDHSEDINR